MQFYKGTFSAATATGNQTISGIVDESAASFTPKAVLIWSTFGSSAAFADGWTFFIGLTDGTTTLSTCTAASDNVAAQRANTLRSTSLVRVVNSAGTNQRVGAFSSFGSGQFVINWTTVTGTAEIFHYIAFGGSDLNVNSSDLIMDDASTVGRATVAISAFNGLIGLTAFGSPSSGGTGTGMGWYVSKSDGSFDQGVATPYIRDNVNPSACYRYQRINQYKAIFQNGTAGTLFTAAARDVYGDAFSANGTSANVFNQVLGFGGIAMAAGNGLQPTATGTQAISGLGFSPKGVIIISVGNTASTTVANDAKLSIGAADRTRQGHAVSASTHAVTPSVCVTNEDTSHVISCITANATAASSTTEAQASIQSIDADGFTLNWNAADATQRQYLWLAFGDAAGGGGGGGSSPRSRTFVGML